MLLCPCHVFLASFTPTKSNRSIRLTSSVTWDSQVLLSQPSRWLAIAQAPSAPGIVCRCWDPVTGRAVPFLMTLSEAPGGSKQPGRALRSPNESDRTLCAHSTFLGRTILPGKTTRRIASSWHPCSYQKSSNRPLSGLFTPTSKSTINKHMAIVHPKHIVSCLHLEISRSQHKFREHSKHEYWMICGLYVGYMFLATHI